MVEGMLVVVGVLVVVVAILQVILLRRGSAGGGDPAVGSRLDVLVQGQERTERTIREEIGQSRGEYASRDKNLREEVTGKIDRLTESNHQRLEGIRVTVEQKLTQIQEGNAAKLEDMRKTVEEKLQGTLDKRIGESFRQVSQQLEQVHKGLGEMQSLATGVGDLKRVLTNVKTRGTWGEVLLGNLLADVLTTAQYASQVATRPGTNEKVDFAIKLPGRGDNEGQQVLLPIDSKFPTEDYQRLLDAYDRTDLAAVEEARKQMVNRVRTFAKDIAQKYVCPPHTTEFAVMYLPAEGLYAEVLRDPGLVEQIQREQRIMLAGPTTLAALLNALQVGFQAHVLKERSGC